MRLAWILLGLALLWPGCSRERTPEKPTPAETAVPSTTQNTGALNLVGTEWKLEDLAGAGVIENSQATLAFPEMGRVAGNGSCNRFMGSVTITGDSLKMGPLAGTRMACASEAVSAQEEKYLKALQGATRYEWKDPYLLVYVEGTDKPLRYTRAK